MTAPVLHYHLVGIAGVGMSALAQALAAQGHSITGSDRYLDQGENLEILKKLQRAGIKLVRQDGSGITPETAGVVVSTAIEGDNADLAAASKLNIPVIHRAVMLAGLVEGKRCIAVSGTSGKTTVTGMIGYIFEQLGMDAGVINGGAVLNWANDRSVGNFREGRPDLWIIEADESDRSFLHFKPDWAVITNISKDHFELDEVVSLFRQFAGRVHQGIVCGPGVSGILGKLKPRIVEHLVEPASVPEGSSFRFRDVDFTVPLAGRHNAENAFLAVELCEALGLDLIRVRDALLSFKGIERRLEKVGEAGGVIVIDDYAHNPAKIHAAWQAVAERSPRVLGVWRPHGYGPLAAMFDELVEAFAGVCRPQDKLFVLPVYYVGGTTRKAATSDDLVRALNDRKIPVELAQDYSTLAGRLCEEAKGECAILCMGARDPELPRFARRILREIKKMTERLHPIHPD